MKLILRKVLPGIVASLLLLSLILPLGIGASATGEFSTQQIENALLEATQGTWSYNGGIITSSSDTPGDTLILTIKNTAQSQATLSFSYDLDLNSGPDDKSTATIGDKDYEALVKDYDNMVAGILSIKNQVFSCELDANESIEIQLTVGPDSGATPENAPSASISIYNLEMLTTEMLSLNFQPAACDYTVYVDSTLAATVSANGTAQPVEAPNTAIFSVSLSNAEGYILVGGRYSDGTAVYAKDGVLSLRQSGSIELILIATTGTAPYLVNGENKWTWESAVTDAVATGKPIIVQTTFSLPQTLVENGVGEGGTYVYTDTDTGDLVYELPAGVVLLLPYSASATTITGAGSQEKLAYANYQYVSGGQPSMNPKDTYVTYEMTIPSGVTLKVADGSSDGTTITCGRIIVGGEIGSGEGGSLYDGGTYRYHSNLVVDGTLKLGDYATLSVTGYVLGEGKVIATGSAAEIYQPMLINDWRGAAAAAQYITTDLGGAKLETQSGEAELMPFTQWGTMNIQADLTMSYGNTMYMYATLAEDGTQYHSHPILVGSGTGLLTLTETDSKIHTTFNPISWGSGVYGLPGKTTVTVEGGAALGSLDLDINISGVGSMAVETSKVTLYVCYMYDIILTGGNYAVDCSLALLPGVSFTVAEDATLTLGSTGTLRFAVLDGLTNRLQQASGNTGYVGSFTEAIKSISSILQGKFEFSMYFLPNGWSVPYAANARYNSKNYPTCKELNAAGLSGDAEFIINGKLVIGSGASFGGIIQTDGGGEVDATNAGFLSTQVQIGVVGASKVLGRYRYQGGMSLHTLKARLNVGGVLTDIAKGDYYYGIVDSIENGGYTFTYYPGVQSTSKNYQGKVYYNVDHSLLASTTYENVPYVASSGANTTERLLGGWTTDPCVAGHHVDKLVADGTAKADGRCDECGILMFYATNVNLGNNLDMLFAFPVDTNVSYAVFTRADHDPVTVRSSEWDTMTINGVKCYVVTYSGFAAKEMCDYVAVTVYDSTGKAVSATKIDSIRDYAMRLLKKVETTPQEGDSTYSYLKSVIVDMLNYGAECQKYFEKTEGYTYKYLATKDLTEAQKAYASTYTVDELFGGDAVTGPQNSQTGAKHFLGSNLITTSNIQFAIAFKDFPSSEDGNSHGYFTYYFTGHKGNDQGTKENPIKVEYGSMTSPGSYHVLNDIVVADARQIITITVYDETGEPVETWTESVAAYAARNQKEEVFKYFLVFADSAKLYLHNRNN